MILTWTLLIKRYNNWRQKNLSRSILSAMITLGFFTVFEKLCLTVKEILIAESFGTSDARDAFLVAIMLPLFISSVVSGSFNAAFIPSYIKVREEHGQIASNKLLSNILLLSFSLLIMISCILALSSSYLFDFLSGFNYNKVYLVRHIFLILLPIPTISGISSILASVLNASERFAMLGMVPIISPLITIVFLLTMRQTIGIYALAIGMVVGSLIEISVMLLTLKRKECLISPRWYGMNSETKEVLRQFVPMLTGAIVMSGSTIIDKTMASSLTSGSVSVLTTGNLVPAFMLGIGATVISGAVFPHFSRLVAVGDWKLLKDTLRTYTKSILLVSIPITIILIILSQPMVRLIFERGLFNTSDTGLVARVQMLYLIQVPFYLLGILIPRVISSFHSNHILMWGAVISFILNIAFDYILMHTSLGVAGIALSTSLVYIISLGYLLIMLKKLIGNVD